MPAKEAPTETTMTSAMCHQIRGECSTMRWKYVILIWGLVLALLGTAGSFMLVTRGVDASQEERIKQNASDINKLEVKIDRLPTTIGSEVRSVVREELNRGGSH